MKRAKEIYQKYYSNISEEDFIKIASVDTISSNLQKDKLGKYAKWLLNLYKRNRLKLEDLYKATEYIAVFDKIVKMNKLIYNDLNHYKSLAELYKVIKPYVKAISNTEKLQKIKKNGAEKLYEDEAFVVIHPKTKQASMLYGKGTQWCTAAKDGDSFRYYNRMGKLYIIIDKRTGKKYQFHAETESFMNEDDEAIDVMQDRETFILEKINATEGLSNYLCTELPYLHAEYLTHLIFTLPDGGYTENIRKNDFCIVQIKNIKALFTHWCAQNDDFVYYLVYDCNEFEHFYDAYFYDEEVFRMGKIYLFYDFRNFTRYILSENYSGFLEICLNRSDLYYDRYFSFRKIKIETTPEMDYCLHKLKIHPEWEMYCEIFYNGQDYYIVQKETYCALYNAHFEEIVGMSLSANQIYVTKTCQPVIIKDKYTGLYDANAGRIRWGYKGVVDKELDWIRRESASI